jgi:ABC-type multidrug transport system ATPase subunit
MNLSSSATDAQVCAAVLTQSAKACQKKGYYCPYYKNYDYQVNTELYIPSPTGKYVNATLQRDTLNCTGQALVQLCPKGYYCPTSFQQFNCPPGYYCGAGFTLPRECAFHKIGCPYSTMEAPIAVILLVTFSVVLFIFMYAYRVFQNEQYFLIEQHSRRYAKFIEDVEKEREANQEKFQQLTELRHRSINAQMGLAGWQAPPGSSRPVSLAANGRRKVTLHEIKESYTPMSTPTASRHLHLSQLLTATLHSKSKEKQASDNMNNMSNLTKKSSILNKALPHFEFQPISEPITISFTNLTLQLPISKQILLNNAFGTIRPFEITCLLGPSGAGKTTLLNLLRGQANYATCSGTILVNGKEIPSLSLLSTEMAFVPQDDIVYEELTVEDNIMYSAKLFNKRVCMKTNSLLPMVFKAEQMLGIAHIRYNLVGGPDTKGISGGQRKRVSIAMEIVKESSLLFLDEPTSGLDSATSISVLHTLHELADLGVNIVATLHQPRYEILELVHSLILLAPGGRIAYHGSPEFLKEHFCQFGYECPVNTNIADFVMDCLAGFIPHKGSETATDLESGKSISLPRNGNGMSGKRNPSLYKLNLSDEIVNNIPGLIPTSSKNGAVSPIEEGKDGDEEDYEEEEEEKERERTPPRPSFLRRSIDGQPETLTIPLPEPNYRSRGKGDKFVKEIVDELCNSWEQQQLNNHVQETKELVRTYAHQSMSFEVHQKVKKHLPQRLFEYWRTLYVCGARQKKLYNQTFIVVFLTCCILVCSGFAIGYLEGTVRLDLNSTPGVLQQTLFSQLIFAIFTCNAHLHLFGNDELMRIREESGGILLVPLFMGKVFSSNVEFIFYPFAFLCGYFPVINSNASFLDYFLIFLTLHLALTGISNIMAIYLHKETRSLGMLGVLVILWIFGGVSFFLFCY